MNKVWFNDSDVPAYIGNVLVAPHTARVVDGDLLPATAEMAAGGPEDGEDRDLQLLDNNVGAVVAGLPAVSNVVLEKLAVAEKAGKTRKGVMEAIGSQRLVRAEEGSVNLSALTSAQLADFSEDGKPHTAAFLAMVQAAIAALPDE